MSLRMTEAESLALGAEFEPTWLRAPRFDHEPLTEEEWAAIPDFGLFVTELPSGVFHGMKLPRSWSEGLLDELQEV